MIADIKKTNVENDMQVLDSIEQIENFLINNFDAQLLEKPPKNEDDLLYRYAYYTDVLYQYIRHYVDKQIFVVSNEIRAMFGHLADYRVRNITGSKNDLIKAHGHLRRMNLDAFKILCDMFEDKFTRYSKKIYKLDFRKHESDYLKNFFELHIRARKLYLKAQKEERPGSDMNVHNILVFYYDASKAYMELNRFYEQKKTMVRSLRRHSMIKYIVAVLMFLLTIISDVMDCGVISDLF